MSDLVIIVPSRGRPEEAAQLAIEFADTCQANTWLLFAVDDSDPLNEGYSNAVRMANAIRSDVKFSALRCPSKTMVEALNMAASYVIKEHPDIYAIGFMGDDHRPRTVGWDVSYLEALRAMKTGIVYGNDMYQGRNLPTQCAMTSDIVRTLGFMAPPSLHHMYVDNFWLALGMQTKIMYLPEVIVEHMHPAAGKSELDEGYERVNAPEVFAADAKAFGLYQASEMYRDVAKVRDLYDLRATSKGKMVITSPTHEWQLFEKGTIPEYTTSEWYLSREHAPHLDQPVHRDRLMQTASFVAQAAFSTGYNTLVDLGAGDGGLLSLLGPRLKAWGYDLMPTNLEMAKERGVDVRYGDVVAGDIEWGQIAVCTEMLEHLVDPHAFVRRISEHASALVCSSPATERPGNAYEFHTWAWDLDGYRALVEQGGFRLLRQRRVGPFQVILAVRP